jgi:AAA+ superfamily predicted ATPase
MSNSLTIEPIKFTPESKKALNDYSQLVGIDHQKKELMSALQMILNPGEFKNWLKKHGHDQSDFLKNYTKTSPLILLSGDVGCGKSELANSCGAAHAKVIDNKVNLFSTPSDLRGTGRVGEISARITAIFNQLAQQSNDLPTILLLDEADDVASSREKDHQHHEDRAGVNALIKELDRLERSTKKVAVIFITNRAAAMDPAILRRAATEIKFERPNAIALTAAFEQITKGLDFSKEEKEKLVKACLEKEVPFTFSDLYRKVVKQTIINCWQAYQPFNFEALLKAIQHTNPSPKFIEK